MRSVSTHLIDTGRSAEDDSVGRRRKNQERESPQANLKTAKDFLNTLAKWMPGKCLACNNGGASTAIYSRQGATAQWKHADVEAQKYDPPMKAPHVQDWRPIPALMTLGESASYLDVVVGSHLAMQV
jgi:hypothetical protein